MDIDGIRMKEPIKITIYNHKGGVGKTTLTVNIAAAIAKTKKVLIVDSDPQCNLTSYLLSDDVVDNLLDKSGDKEGRTLWTSLKPINDQTGSYQIIEPFETGITNLYILPGDIRLSEFEQYLGDAWTDCLKRRIGAIDATTSISKMTNEIGKIFNFDFIFFDAGPNIGPLNRVLLLDTTHFIIPVACDHFSVRALSTMGQTLKSWIIDWATIQSLAPDGIYLFKGKPHFLGYIPQRFRVYGQEMANSPATYLRSIKRRMYSDVISVLRDIDTTLAPENAKNCELGKVKEYGVIIQEAQKLGIPLSQVTGTYSYQSQEAEVAFSEISNKILQSI